jgi:restriction system protein
MALWLCRTGRHGEHEAKFLEDDRIYLTWVGLDRDLSDVKDLKALYKMLGELYPKFTHGHRVQNSGQIWSFARRMAPGDWVVVPSKRKATELVLQQAEVRRKNWAKN